MTKNGIKMSWVEKNRKINNWGEGGGGRIIRDAREFIDPLWSAVAIWKLENNCSVSYIRLQNSST